MVSRISSPVMSGIEHFSTRRMVAQRLRSRDFEEIRRLHLHPQVMKTLSVDGQTLPDTATRDGLEQNDAHWEHHGFGLWIFRDKESGEFLGRAGLKWYRIDDDEIVGLAYAVLFDRWNLGLATEMGEASLAVGFRRLGLASIGTWTLPMNVSSKRVMEKLGFSYEKDVVFAGLPHLFYRLTAAEWKSGAEGDPPALL
jgi:RimJ/RimL family protein N-acetyltransferase